MASITQQQKDALIAADQATLAADQATLAADQATLAADTSTLTAAQSVLDADNSTLLADQSKLSAAQAAVASAQAAVTADLAAVSAAQASVSGAQTIVIADQEKLAADEAIVVDGAPAVYAIPLSLIEYIPNDSSVKVGLHLGGLDPAIYAQMADWACQNNGDPHATKAAGGRRVQGMMRWKGGPNPAWTNKPAKGARTAEQAAHDVAVIEMNGVKDGDIMQVAIFSSAFPYQPIYRKQHTKDQMNLLCPIVPGEWCCAVENGHDPTAPVDSNPVMIGLSAPFVVHTAPHVPLEGEFYYNGFNVDETPVVVAGPMNGLPNISVPGEYTLAHLESDSFFAQPYGPAINVIQDMAFIPIGKMHAHFQCQDRNGGYNTINIQFRDKATGLFPSFTFQSPGDVFHTRYEAEGHWTSRKYVDWIFFRVGDELLDLARKSWPDFRKVIPMYKQGPLVVVGATATQWELLIYQQCAKGADGYVQPPPVKWSNPQWFDPSSYPYPPAIRGSISSNNVIWLDDSLATRQGVWAKTATVGGVTAQYGMNLDQMNDNETGANVRHLIDMFLSLTGVTVFEDGILQFSYTFGGAPFVLGDEVSFRFVPQIYHGGAEDGSLAGPNFGEFPGAEHDPFNLVDVPLDNPPGSVIANSNGDLTQCHFDNLSFCRRSDVPSAVPVWGAPVPAGS